MLNIPHTVERLEREVKRKKFLYSEEEKLLTDYFIVQLDSDDCTNATCFVKENVYGNRKLVLHVNRSSWYQRSLLTGL